MPISMEPATVGILLFPGVEVLDFAGPYEVFSVAARLGPKLGGLEQEPFQVVTVAESSNKLIARGGLSVCPHHGFDDAPSIDVLIVPGGVMTEPLNNPATLEWLRHASTRATLTASVCTGAFLLGAIGLLDSLSATTHWEDVAELRERFPHVHVVDDQAFVDQGEIVTSAGISAGIGMSLHLVERLLGPRVADITARQLQYDWRSTPREG